MALNLRPGILYSGTDHKTSQHLLVEFADDKVSLLQVRGSSNVDLPILRIEPPVIGGIYPGHNEDRELLKLNPVSQVADRRADLG